MFVFMFNEELSYVVQINVRADVSSNPRCGHCLLLPVHLPSHITLSHSLPLSITATVLLLSIIAPCQIFLFI